MARSCHGGMISSIVPNFSADKCRAYGFARQRRRERHENIIIGIAAHRRPLPCWSDSAAAASREPVASEGPVLTGAGKQLMNIKPCDIAALAVSTAIALTLFHLLPLVQKW